MSDEAQTVKVIEVMGESTESWEDAAHNALEDATATIEGISGVKVVGQTAKIEDEEIVQYRSTLHISFPIQR